MPVGATIAAVGSVASAGIGAMGASSAAKTQASAANNAAQLQMQMYNTTRGDLAPYRSAGQAALPSVYAMLGLGGSDPLAMGNADSTARYILSQRPDVASSSWLQGVPTATIGDQTGDGQVTDADRAIYWWKNFGQKEGLALPQVDSASAMQSALENTPGYQFTKSQGIQAITNQLAAAGLGGTSGAYAKGLAKYVTGLADNTYQQQLGNYMGLAGMGQNAAAQTGTAGSAASGQAGSSLTNAGTAAAGGTVGVANALSGGISSGTNAYLMSRMLGGGMYGGSGANLSQATDLAQSIAGGGLFGPS